MRLVIAPEVTRLIRSSPHLRTHKEVTDHLNQMLQCNFSQTTVKRLLDACGLRMESKVTFTTQAVEGESVPVVAAPPQASGGPSPEPSVEGELDGVGEVRFDNEGGGRGFRSAPEGIPPHLIPEPPLESLNLRGLNGV